ncbi:hypothetical protein FSST1_006706 [Fusarium sambucinum]
MDSARLQRGGHSVSKGLDHKLASFYDRKVDKSYIIYPDEKNPRIVDSRNAKDRDIPNTDDSRDYTGLACVRVPGDKGGDSIYMYYFASKGGRLQRTI